MQTADRPQICSLCLLSLSYHHHGSCTKPMKTADRPQITTDDRQSLSSLINGPSVLWLSAIRRYT